jgi:hypothetical protein
MYCDDIMGVNFWRNRVLGRVVNNIQIFQEWFFQGKGLTPENMGKPSVRKGRDN